ncbi:DUF1850 domain-containing protein [Lipingzhangella sp. LS1_29]|uniref:DUF1850 domain-containing protein n=1 Tax=Lipingzhangella rawalii TaxID=2055835 RepID=A0ABU2H5J8_9ACTN|nr:DUF1850 domain-containing protein [Lipingzhangella rawalii]MDS1270584.1 DUF1850 domain-containing protein [Lipingzhangella rawalii]
MSPTNCGPDRGILAAPSRRIRRIAAAMALAMVAAGAWIPLWPALSVEGAGARAAAVPLGPQDAVTVSWTHSLDGLPVRDTYTLREGQLHLEATRVREFGAGLGHIAGHGTGHADGEWWVVSNIDRPIGELHLRAGSAEVNHRLHHPGGELGLSECWAGESLTVRAQRVSTLRLLDGWLGTHPCAHPSNQAEEAENR